MKKAINVLVFLLELAAVPLWPLMWLICRLTAETCPNCGSKWQTHVIGVWPGSVDWQCKACKCCWLIPYGQP